VNLYPEGLPILQEIALLYLHGGRLAGAELPEGFQVPGQIVRMSDVLRPARQQALPGTPSHAAEFIVDPNKAAVEVGFEDAERV
jgi:hypothetical protein